MEYRTMEYHQLSRRALLASLTATAGLAVVGCGRGGTPETNRTSPANAKTAAAPATSMTVYRDPSCGCCQSWAEIARNAGFEVEMIDYPDMAAIKRQHGVPQELLSCHTTTVSGYTVEGHVPLADVQRLLSEKPPGVRGIGVPGMPLGSPGMEASDGTKQPFQVMAFDAAGRLSVFRA